jgi:hypothetical protein
MLRNVKLPSEKPGSIVPFMEDLREKFGALVACGHDMGAGICNAVANVFPSVLDYILELTESRNPDCVFYDLKTRVTDVTGTF